VGGIESLLQNGQRIAPVITTLVGKFMA
jgi:hypothetical protein